MPPKYTTPYLDVVYKTHHFDLPLVSGSSHSVVDIYFAQEVGLPISPITPLTPQPDTYGHGGVVGEVQCTFWRNNHILHFDAIVVGQLDMVILGGCTFLEKNNIALRPARNHIILDDGEIVEYSRLRRESTETPYSHVTHASSEDTMPTSARTPQCSPMNDELPSSSGKITDLNCSQCTAKCQGLTTDAPGNGQVTSDFSPQSETNYSSTCNYNAFLKYVPPEELPSDTDDSDEELLLQTCSEDYQLDGEYVGVTCQNVQTSFTNHSMPDVRYSPNDTETELSPDSTNGSLTQAGSDTLRMCPSISEDTVHKLSSNSSPLKSVSDVSQSVSHNSLYDTQCYALGISAMSTSSSCVDHSVSQHNRSNGVRLPSDTVSLEHEIILTNMYRNSSTARESSDCTEECSSLDNDYSDVNTLHVCTQLSLRDMQQQQLSFSSIFVETHNIQSMQITHYAPSSFCSLKSCHQLTGTFHPSVTSSWDMSTPFESLNSKPSIMPGLGADNESSNVTMSKCNNLKAHGKQSNLNDCEVLQGVEACDIFSYNVSSKSDNIRVILQNRDYSKDTRSSDESTNRMERKESHDDGVVLNCYFVKTSDSDTLVPIKSCLQDTEPPSIRNHVPSSRNLISTTRPHSKAHQMCGRGSLYICQVCCLRNDGSRRSDKYFGAFTGCIAHLVEVTEEKKICCSVKRSTDSNTHVSEESCYLQDTEPHRIRNRIVLSPTIATTNRAHSKVCHMYGRGSQYVCLVCRISNEGSHSSNKYCGSFSSFIAHLVEVTKKKEPFVHRTEKVLSFTTISEKGGQQEEPHHGRPPELCMVILLHELIWTI